MHLAGQLPSGGFFQQAFDEEEQILGCAVKVRRGDAIPIQPVERCQQFALFFASQKSAAGQHARVRVVDLEQRAEEILLSVFEVVDQDCFGVNRRGERIGHPVPS